MTREDIIRMAQESKFATEERGDGLHHVFVFNFQGSETEITEELERFAALIASAEREACAKVCESIDMESFGVLPVRTVMITNHCAEAIRARGQA
jgi:hypothetical protein